MSKQIAIYTIQFSGPQYNLQNSLFFPDDTGLALRSHSTAQPCSQARNFVR